MLTYLVQLTLGWGLFAALYALLLRRETFFRANRFYLLGTVVLGLVLPVLGPWLPIRSQVPETIRQVLPVVTVGLQQAETVVSGLSWSAVLGWGYLAGAALVAFRLLWGICRLVVMIIEGKKERLPDGLVLVRSAAAGMPFSFFHWVFVPATSADDRDFQYMLAHEKSHASGRHSLDVLLLELLCVVFWFHPLAHWYRLEMRSVHEFLADAAAARPAGRKQYGLLLLRQADARLPFALANHFFQAPLKQRLLMLTRHDSPLSRSWKYMLLLPVTAVLWACNPQIEPDPVVDHQQTGKALELFELEQSPSYPQDSLVHFLGTNIHYPDAARQAKAEGIVVMRFVIDQTGQVTDVENIPGTPDNPKMASRQDMIDEATRVVRAMPRWKPGYKDGKPVACRFTLPIRFKLE